MTVELRPGGVACNLGCTYCYQEPLRQTTGNRIAKYDLDKMLEVAEATGQQFSLFGGEILLIPIKDIEVLFKRSFELHGKCSLQTNGTLITDKHIELFKKYNVNVGISIDGPEELNDFRVTRKNSTTERIREHTTKTITNIAKLRENGIHVGIIITVHRLNGLGKNLERLKEFILWLGGIGVKGGNVHALEVDETMPEPEKHVLTPEENAETFLDLAKFFDENPDLQWSPFREMAEILISRNEKATCLWKNCDPWDTQAVYGIEGDGALSNCGRTNKEGIDWYKSDTQSYLRYISLYNTPKEHNGCKGCRFFLACGGSCPGESIDGDFRNKTIHCMTNYKLYEFYEKKVEDLGLTPVTKYEFLDLLEKTMINELAKGKAVSIQEGLYLLKRIISKPTVLGGNDTND